MPGGSGDWIPYPGFCGGCYRSQSTNIAIEDTVNMYPELVEASVSKAQNRLALYPTPGLASFYDDVSTDSSRGSFYQDGRMFFVQGYRLLEVYPNGTTVERGTVATDDNPASLASSGDAGRELFVASGRQGYILNLDTNVFTLVPTITPTMVGYLAGRFVYLDAATSTVAISAIFNGLSWNPLLIRQRTLAADKWISMVVTQTNIWLFGSQTYEVWYDTGIAPFPFAPVPGALFPIGCGAAFSARRLGGTAVCWITANEDGQGQVYKAVQFAPERISNHALEYHLQSLTTVSDARTMVYQEFGHDFYIVTMPNSNLTYVYDDRTGIWHRRARLNPQTGTQDAWLPRVHAFGFNKHIVGVDGSSKLYQMAVTNLTDPDTYIRRERTVPHSYGLGSLIRFKELQVIVQAGLGTATGQGYDPHMMLQYSDDGGMTWGNEVTEPIGKMGEYWQPVRFQNLGQSDNRVFRIAMSDPIQWRIGGANLRFKVDGAMQGR